jgi:hypothetical protein
MLLGGSAKAKTKTKTKTKDVPITGTLLHAGVTWRISFLMCIHFA